MTPIKIPYKMLIYDIENNKCRYRAFPSTREQYLNHRMLVHGYKTQKIICIAAKWYGEKSIFSFTGEGAIEQLDLLIKQADVVIGKNNIKFDDKHVNTQRMLSSGVPMPQMSDIVDDVEAQLRKYFILPSYSLDAVAELLGFGGKDKMEDEDWNNIQDGLDFFRYKSMVASNRRNEFAIEMFGKSAPEVCKDAQNSMTKMIKYNKVDVIRTEQVLTRILPYIKLRKNASTQNEGKGCITCGSMKLVATKVITAGKTRYQEFECLGHAGYGGRATVRYDKNRNKIYGKMG